MKNKGLLRDFPTDNGHILGTILKDMPPKLVPMVHTHLHAYKHNIMQEYYKGLFPGDECTLYKEAQHRQLSAQAITIQYTSCISGTTVRQKSIQVNVKYFAIKRT